MQSEPIVDESCGVPATPLPSRSTAGFSRWFLAILLVLIAGVATLYRGVGRGLNHDEHQFLSPGILLSRYGLQPYRDYPLFHMPNLIYVYAAMDQVTSDPILGAKIASALSTTGVVAMIFWLALARTGNVLRPWERLWAGTVVALLLLFDPLFLYTSGKTWNHEVPAFLLVLAAVFHVESFRSKRNLLAALSGLAAGLAVGTRLTYAPIVGAFLFHLGLCGGDGWRCRLKAILSWGGGCTIGMGPSIYFYFAHHEAFVFDNLRFPRLTLLDPENTRVQKTIRLQNKIRFLFKEVVTRSWPLFFLFGALSIVPLVQAIQRRRFDGGSVFVVILLVATIAGCFAPSRYQYQHFYAVPVVLALGIVYLCKEGVIGAGLRKTKLAVISALAVLSMVGFLWNDEDRPNGVGAYREAIAMRDPALWFSRRYREQAGVLTRYVPGGEKILTLAPTAALEAGRPIYPELATGVFGWRTARFVQPDLRRKLHYVAPEELAEYLRGRPPAGILTGVEDEKAEAPLVDWAVANGYEKIDLEKKRVLWIPSKEYHIHRQYYRLDDLRLQKSKGGEKEKKASEEGTEK